MYHGILIHMMAYMIDKQTNNMESMMETIVFPSLHLSDIVFIRKPNPSSYAIVTNSSNHAKSLLIYIFFLKKIEKD